MDCYRYYDSIASIIILATKTHGRVALHSLGGLSSISRPHCSHTMATKTHDRVALHSLDGVSVLDIKTPLQYRGHKDPRHNCTAFIRWIVIHIKTPLQRCRAPKTPTIAALHSLDGLSSISRPHCNHVMATKNPVCIYSVYHGCHCHMSNHEHIMTVLHSIPNI